VLRPRAAGITGNTDDLRSDGMTTPVSMQHLVQKLEELKKEMDGGKLRHGEYDQRLARIIGELRDRKLDAERADILSTLDDLLKRGVITPSVKTHVIARLGLA
jgi:hypothetical protein